MNCVHFLPENRMQGTGHKRFPVLARPAKGTSPGGVQLSGVPLKKKTSPYGGNDMNDNDFVSNVIKTGASAAIGALIAGIPGLLIGGIGYLALSTSRHDDAVKDD